MRLKIQGIHVNVLDEGAGIPVLLAHGVPDSGESWRGVVDGLLTHGGFRCIAGRIAAVGGVAMLLTGTARDTREGADN